MRRLLIIVLMLMGAAIAFAQEPEALIKEMIGTVELKAEGTTHWIQASPGDRIEKSMMISTGFKSMAVLSLGKSTIMVRPLTRLSLENLMSQGDTETIDIGLRSGRMQVDVKAPAGGKASFTVQTPTATASVRGTMFTMNKMSIRVFEGSVLFQPASGGQPVLVNAGQSSQIDEISGKATNPLIQAEAERRLSALAGESYIPTGNAGKKVSGSGSLSGITVKPGSGTGITVKPGKSAEITVKPKPKSN